MDSDTVRDDLFEQILELSSGLQIDERELERLDGLLSPLKKLCKAVKEDEDKLDRINQEISDVISDSDEINIRTGSLGFILNTHALLNKLLTCSIDGYKELAQYYQLNLEGIELETDDGQINTVSKMRAFQSAGPAFAKACQLFIEVKKGTYKTIHDAHKLIDDHSKYLKDKFVKSDDSEPTQQDIIISLLMGDSEPGPRAKYVKIELFDGKPVLTDVLLSVINDLPSYWERTVREGKDKKKSRTIREISTYAVQNSTNNLIAISNPAILSYIENPRTFFYKLGTAVKKFYDLLKDKFEPTQKEMLDSPSVRYSIDARAKKILFGGGEKLERDLEGLLRADFDDITQVEDDYLPDNRKETDHFKLRSELMGLLYKAMGELSELSSNEEDWEKKEILAKKVILEAVELKSRIDDVLMPQARRQLRQDRRSDNEYYEGTQASIGKFEFARQPAPTVKMNEVIGESFDRAKGHLKEIIETGEFPNIMRLSAPGRKVRSNILLIGPYGCGKTELARAVCADPRIIGASVSAKDILTAYLHESVNNVGRVYEAARELYREGRCIKPVVLVFDEYDSLFTRSERDGIGDKDMKQIEKLFLQMLDGMGDYNGIITMALTNEPKVVPKGIMRRFRYVDVVGQLTNEERAKMLQMYLESSLPTHPEVQEHYSAWAGKLEDAPGDVVRKVVDEVHFSLLPEYVKNNPKEAACIEKVLREREIKNGELDEKDVAYVKKSLSRLIVVTPDDVNLALDNLLKQPPIRMQIDTAKRVYREANGLIEEISSGRRAFGLTRRGETF